MALDPEPNDALSYLDDLELEILRWAIVAMRAGVPLKPHEQQVYDKVQRIEALLKTTNPGDTLAA